MDVRLYYPEHFRRVHAPHISGFWLQKPIQRNVFGTRDLQYWVLGPTGIHGSRFAAHQGTGSPKCFAFHCPSCQTSHPAPTSPLPAPAKPGRRSFAKDLGRRVEIVHLRVGWRRLKSAWEDGGSYKS